MLHRRLPSSFTFQPSGILPKLNEWQLLAGGEQHSVFYPVCFSVLLVWFLHFKSNILNGFRTHLTVGRYRLIPIVALYLSTSNQGLNLQPEDLLGWCVCVGCGKRLQEPSADPPASLPTLNLLFACRRSVSPHIVSIMAWNGLLANIVICLSRLILVKQYGFTAFTKLPPAFGGIQEQFQLHDN